MVLNFQTALHLGNRHLNIKHNLIQTNLIVKKPFNQPQLTWASHAVRSWNVVVGS